jgi:hypothetical protein
MLLQSTSQEGKDLESEDKKSFGSYNKITVDSWH